MKKLILLILILITFFILGCSNVSNFFIIYHTKNKVNEVEIHVGHLFGKYRCVLIINNNLVDDEGQLYIERNIWKSTNELSNYIYNHWSNKIKMIEDSVL